MLSLIRRVKTSLEATLSFPSFRGVGSSLFTLAQKAPQRRLSMVFWAKPRRLQKGRGPTAASPEDLPIGSWSLAPGKVARAGPPRHIPRRCAPNRD